MALLVVLVPAFPLLGFLLLFASAGRLPRRAIAVIGTASVGLSAALALALAAMFVRPVDAGLGTWMAIGTFTPRFSLHLDQLSLVMTLVVSGIGFLIHLYATESMDGDEGYGRFFAAMNLFVAAMLVLVLAGDLLLLYLGWEGVGLCSYLLIGHWYRDPSNGLAARKAFVMTRVGDTLMAVGLLLLFTRLGTTDIQALMQQAAARWPVGAPPAIAAAALLLGGAVGKSAQVPLHTWLPDAMAGPTPVSALIHAATMVTAGIYLIARTHALYDLAPPVRFAVAVIGAVTLLLGGFSALNQSDLKRILAYSTISQIGTMVLGLGLGAWPAAIFHLVTHAFFKALLFLSAGIVIHHVHEERDIFRMGGLRRRLPLAFWSFLIGAVSLAALPFVDAGFYSKAMILAAAWPRNKALWAAGAFGGFLTALYIFRAVFTVFFGPLRTEPAGSSGIRILVPLAVLSVLALAGGLLDVPGFLAGLLPAAGTGEPGGEAIAATAAVLGVAIAYLAFLRRPRPLAPWWGFDRLYDRLLVRPFIHFANRGDSIDSAYGGIADLCGAAHRVLSRTQNGRVRWYAAGITAGAIVAIALSVLA